MKYKILPIILLTTLIYTKMFAQSCIDLRHPIYALNQIDSIGNLSYSGNTPVPDFYSTDDSLDAKCTDGMGCDNSNAALVYDVYYPSTAAYAHYDIAPLPAVIMFHSGSFSDCSNKGRDSTKDYCKAFAERGFVVFNVEYRRGRLLDGRKLSPEQLLAIYRAVQDGNGAIRTIIQRQINNEAIFKFDTSKLFLAGSSSGAIIALNIAFCNQSEMDSAYPGASDPGILGTVLKDDYYGGLSIPFSIKGVLSMWGGLLGNGSTSPGFPDCITSTDKIPVIAFHGEKDRTIPDSVIKAVFSSGTRAIASQCDFTYQLTSTTGFAYQYGSIPIYKRLQSLNIPSELYLDTNAGHGLDSTSDYGLPTNNIDSVEDYIVSRAVIFFKSILDNTTGNIKQTMFVDTEDTTNNCDNLPPPGIITDSLALVDLYNSTNGPSWFHQDNWLTGPVSSWYGISVTNNRVSQVFLVSNNLTGTIPSSLGNLSNLVGLYLNYNRLNGNITAEIGNLSKLSDLHLAFNQLNGKIPSALGNLINLSELYLADNELSGSIPPQLGKLLKLYYLDLSNNQLTGNIPSEFGNLSNLSEGLYLYGNELSGNIPPELSKLLNLYYLDLSNNHLSGSIPPELGKLLYLDLLYLSNNELSGNIPPELGKLIYLSNLDLSNNELSGNIPSELGKPVYCSSLDLSYNQLSGEIPPELGNLSSLSRLNLNNNQLSGKIPVNISNLTDLYYLFLDHNKLTGTIPSSIVNLTQLDSLDISHNQFTFDGMELVAQTFPFAKYSNQARIPLHINNNALSVSAGGSLDNNTYVWYKKGEAGYTKISGDSVFHPTETGVYAVRVRNKIATNLNLFSDTVQYTAPVSLNAFSAKESVLSNSSISIYPNPAKNILHVQSNSNASFSLLDQNGKTLFTTIINKVGNINVSGIVAGEYYLKNNSTNAVEKIFIVR